MTPEGLTSEEAARRRAQYGSNTLPEPGAEPLWRALIRQLRSPLIYILLFALAIELVVWVTGDAHVPWEALAIGVILALNAGLGLWQERKAEHALAQLERIAAPRAWVMRDGKLQHLPSADLVPGDLVRVEAGDRVPADLVGRRLENVMVDESILTGESIPVDKAPGAELLAGTLVARGIAHGEVIRTGLASAMGRLVQALTAVRPGRTPLERQLDGFGRTVARWVAALAVAIALAGLWIEGVARFPQVFLFAVALAVAAIPEGLPAILTLALTLGVQRMARRKAVVRKLVAVEALGSVTVIASDKTGTLTENRLEVREVDTPDRPLALRAMALATDADHAAGAGDPLELAILRYVDETLDGSTDLRDKLERVSSRSFESTAKFMRVTVRRDGVVESYFKGAPEVLLERSALTADERERWTRAVERHASEGYRLIGLAWGEGDHERDLCWLGVVLLWDPPRAGVSEALRQAREAGVRVMMLTGDHPATAAAVARTLGMDSAVVVTGPALDAMSADERRQAVRDASVFARVTPVHKLEIVEALKADGEIVAVTGDGVNDAPALKRADVGIAMGLRGSDVSREVADLVLLDDDFATIVAAIEEGRGIYLNIRKFVRFLFSTNLSEVILVVVGAFAAFALDLRDATGALLLPLTAAQLLWINLITDGAPALALTLDRNPGVMRAPPRARGAALLDRASLQFILVSGVAKALVAFVILGLLPRIGESLDGTRTAVFIAIAAGQLLFAYPARRTRPAPLSNPALHLAVLAGFVAQILVVTVPGLREAFQSVPIALTSWLAVVAAWLVAWALAELVSRLVRPPTPS
ncbi:MAG: cation-transporting P-type ATPase [Gemmatimonadetes bacterium]|nr:cation-transporting P-type ATPase [Gemmatimonadota bacterium]